MEASASRVPANLAVSSGNGSYRRSGASEEPYYPARGPGFCLTWTQDGGQHPGRLSPNVDVCSGNGSGRRVGCPEMLICRPGARVPDLRGLKTEASLSRDSPPNLDVSPGNGSGWRSEVSEKLHFPAWGSGFCPTGIQDGGQHPSRPPQIWIFLEETARSGGPGLQKSFVLRLGARVSA